MTVEYDNESAKGRRRSVVDGTIFVALYAKPSAI